MTFPMRSYHDVRGSLGEVMSPAANLCIFRELHFDVVVHGDALQIDDTC